MPSWMDNLDLKPDELNVRIMRGIVEAYGNSRAGRNAREDISGDLIRAGWKHIPEKLPTISTVDRHGIPVAIVIYRNGSLADSLISATLKPEMGNVDIVKRAVKLIARDQ